MALKSETPKDISSEVYREYDLGGRKYRVDNPERLYIGDTTHRVVDTDGIVHCIPFPRAGDIVVVLKWKNRGGTKEVQF